jgi:4-diphosphocytidyl-2-C-methyl-D-erythritol kinase
MLRVQAPAKVNLTLHVGHKRDDGYHDLQSLVTFADIGDTLEFAPASSFRFHVSGPYASAFSAKDLDSSPDSGNLVVRAVYKMAERGGFEPLVSITLHKNLPLAGGLGGGSSDAAACVWGLQRLLNRSIAQPHLDTILAELGSDVPVCYAARPSIMSGRGEVIAPAPELPEIPVVFINAGQVCPTPSVFKAFAPPGSKPAPLPIEGFREAEDLLSYVRKSRNDLEGPAQNVSAPITGLLDDMQNQQGCVLSRLAGSGGTVYGLFRDEDEAAEAALSLQQLHKRAWVRASWLNRFHRY